MEVSRQEIDRISIENEQATEMLESGRMHRHLPEMLRADIEFRDLSYCVPDGRKEEKAILRSVSGIFCSGQLSGILGPSGAGKSTLLNVLAGYRCVGETGLINVNGQPRVVRQFRKTSRYIMQEDAVQPFLTVMETMMIAAYLKLGGGIPYKQKREVIKEILTMLRLENSTRTTTCMLSGGERKRLSIALELLNNPAILFLDEPTTGLDETSSLQCMSLLKKIAEGGRTIICSIHTPSASIFSMFDHVYVMARGQCVYQGSRTNILPFLSSFGLHCPITYNIADFIIEVSGGEYGAEHVPKMVSAVNNGKVYKWEIASSSSVQEEFSQMEIMDKDADGEILHLCGNKGKQKKEDVFDTSVWLQFRVLTYRTFLQMLRNLNYLYLKLIMYIFLGIVVGMVFWNIGHDGSKTLYNFGYCYIVIVVCFYIPMLPMLTKFPMEVNLLKREYFNKWYSLNAYYLSVNISYIPLEMILSAIFCIVSYYMSDQPLELIRGIQFFIICMLVVMISLNFGMAISSTFNILNSSFLGPVLGTPLMLLAVHNLGIGSKGTPFIVRLIMHTSYLRFGVEGLTMSIYGRNRTKLFCPKTEDYCHFSYPQEIIKQVGMEDSSYWIAIVGLLVSFVAIQSIFYLLLRWRLSMKLKFPVVLHIERTIKMYLNMNRRKKLEAQCLKVAENLSEEEENSANTALFLFHSNITSVVSLHEIHSNLTSLTIIGQPLSSLSGIELLKNLSELWVVECQIQDASPVMKCCNVKALYLYSNNIFEIPDLSALTKLRVLCLFGNKITCIKNLQHLTELKELFLCNNKIRKLGKSLEKNKKLTVLNMSGNPLYYLQDVKSLCKNTCLESLSFTDPVHGICPVVQLCNYRSYVIQTIPSLRTLDSYPVQQQERDHCKAFFKNKVRYYNMLQQILYAEYCAQDMQKESDGIKKLEQFRHSLFNYNIKELQGLQDKKQQEQVEKENISEKLKHLNLKIKTWSACSSHFKQSQIVNLLANKYKLNYGLQNVGNVEFYQNNRDCELLIACQEMLSALTCPETFRECGITSVKVMDVIKVTNKSLERFNSDIPCSLTDVPTFMVLCSSCETFPELLDHFSTDFIYAETELTHISDCLVCADHTWIESVIKWKKKIFDVPEEIKTAERFCVIVQVPSSIPVIRVENQCKNEQQKESTTAKCEEKLKKCNTYQIKDMEFIKPVFIVTFKYMYKDIFEIVRKNLGWNCNIHSDNATSTCNQQYQVLNSSTLTALVPSYTNPDVITNLVLKGCGLISIGKLPLFPNIIEIDLSFNHLKSFCGFEAFIKTVNMNLSFNSFKSLDGMMEFTKLRSVNVSWNFLSQLKQCLFILKRASSQLSELDISRNPITDLRQTEHILYFVHKHLPGLHTFNGININTDFTSKLKVLNMKNDILVDAGKSVPTYVFQSVDLKWKAQIMKELKTYNNVEYESDNECNKIKWLSVTGEKIINIKEDEILTYVEYVDLSGNLLEQLDFLQDCLNIKELNLSNNIICDHMENIFARMKNLTRLDLSGNYITRLEAFTQATLPALKILNVSNNLLKNLNGIQSCEHITEFYASNNNIQQFRDIFDLRTCCHLQIINFMNNSITQNALYIMFIIFHFKQVEYVDKHHVREADVQQATQLFGGCLDREYLIKQHKVAELQHLTTLTLAQCALKQINLPGDVVPNLKSINLSHNLITSIMGLQDLPSLKVLCMMDNKLGQCLEHKERYNRNGKYFPQLEVLYLNSNNIKSLKNLDLNKLPKLQVLYLQHNQIRFLSGHVLPVSIQNLIMDHNLIENISLDDQPELTEIKELYLEGNKIRTLQFLQTLANLHRLFLARNKINDYEEIKHIETLKSLAEVTMYGNPVCHKYNHYKLVLQVVPSLRMIDGTTLKSTHNIK